MKIHYLLLIFYKKLSVVRVCPTVYQDIPCGEGRYDSNLGKQNCGHGLISIHNVCKNKTARLLDTAHADVWCPTLNVSSCVNIIMRNERNDNDNRIPLDSGFCKNCLRSDFTLVSSNLFSSKAHHSLYVLALYFFLG